MGPRVKEKRGYHLLPIRMVLRVVVKLTGAGGESRSPPTIGVTGAGSYTAVWSLASGSRGGTERPISRRNYRLDRRSRLASSLPNGREHTPQPEAHGRWTIKLARTTGQEG